MVLGYTSRTSGGDGTGQPAGAQSRVEKGEEWIWRDKLKISGTVGKGATSSELRSADCKYDGGPSTVEVQKGWRN